MNNNNKLTNVVMRVSQNYIDKYPFADIDKLKSLSDFDKQLICDESVAEIGTIMEPAFQGPEYKPVYGYLPSPIGLEMDDSYGPDNDEYTEAFEEGYGRKPRAHNENPVFVGSVMDEKDKKRQRLAVFNDRDYEKWAYNHAPMIPKDIIFSPKTPDEFVFDGAKVSCIPPYRTEYGPDGKKATVGLNPLSSSNAVCNQCGTLFNLDEEADKCKGIPHYEMRYEKDLHFCSMKCRMAYKNEHNMTPEEIRAKTTAVPGRDEAVGEFTGNGKSKDYYSYRKTNY